MEEKRDLGIAVNDAVRLQECLGWLAADFAARPFVIGDDLLDQTRFWTNGTGPDAIDMIHRWRTKSVAENLLSRAVLDGVLPLWVRRPEGEAKVDRFAIPEFGPHSVRNGAYYPTSRDWQSDLGKRPLWVKHEDWRVFHDAIMRARYPEEYAAPADAEPAEESASATPVEPTPKPIIVRVADAHLKDWWKRLGPDGQSQSQIDLLEMCRAAFPGRHISRQRIRDLTGPRKRGKKPFRHKPTAKKRRK